jgi:twitching motility protein PilT
LRQDPDVILVGEMRDYETIETALTRAETGHLVLSTLHTRRRHGDGQPDHLGLPAAPAEAGPPAARRGATRVVSMRLVRAPGRPGPRARRRGAAVDRIHPRLRREKEKTKLIQSAIAAGTSQYGMQTFDQSLYTCGRLS